LSITETGDLKLFREPWLDFDGHEYGVHEHPFPGGNVIRADEKTTGAL
jgi:hypothetical protein